MTPVSLSLSDATQLVGRCVDHASDTDLKETLAVLHSADRPNDLDWWQSYPRNEGISRRVRCSALAYLLIAVKGQTTCMQGTFPTIFQFADSRAQHRPDKGVIKASLKHGLIEMSTNSNFSITQKFEQTIKLIPQENALFSEYLKLINA